MSRTRERTTAEWVTFVGSCLVLAVVVALVLSMLVGSRDPAAPRAVATGDVRSVDGASHVTVAVTNSGDETATDVRVVMAFTVGAETREADQVLDFLAGGETRELVFVADPAHAAGSRTVTVTGWTAP